MVPVVFAGNISAEATTPAGNIFAEAMRGVVEKRLLLKEEIHVSKRRYVESVDEPVTLKSTRAVIERE
jgi:hypothetical protein